MSGKYILAIDQGTTGSTSLLLKFVEGKNPQVLCKQTVDFEQHYPKAGWVEHDLDQIWASVRSATQNTLSQAEQTENGFRVSDIEAIGITNQRETLCLFDRKTSAPARKAIVWQCRRSSEICKSLKEKGHELEFKQKTGLVLDPYFSGTKLKWILDNEPDVAGGVANGTTIVGTIDTFLLHRLTGGGSFATEPSNASRTLLFDIKKSDWSDELCQILGLSNRDALPEIKDSSADFGQTKGLDFLPDGIPIMGMLGDQQAALAGQTCFGIGEAKCTYGTGAFLLVNTGSEVKYSDHGLLSTVAWRLKGKSVYALEGSSFIAGATMQFLRDQFEFLSNAADSEKMAGDVTGAPEVYFVPALAGLGAPYWNAEARGAFLGLTRGTTQSQMVRAGLEGICFQVNDLIYSMNQDASEPMKVLRVDGGATANNLLMQIQANYSGIPIDRPVITETTAFGAGLFAGLGAGLFSSLDDLADARIADTKFSPQSSGSSDVEAQLSGWKKAVQAVVEFSR